MIYLLEDDDSIRELVVYTLSNTGLEAKGFGTPSQFFTALSMKLPSLVLLDLMLPEESGLSVLAKLRADAKTSKLPVIILTAKGSEYDRVIGLDSGADDYITKPFGMMELLARVRALLRRVSAEEQTREYTIGKMYVNPSKHIVRSDGKDVPLTFKEFELLCYLLENRGIVMTRDKILSKIWEYDFDGENRTIDVHIRTLRQKLGECGNYIETVRGIGYKIGDEYDEAK